MAWSISASVGEGGKNILKDLETVQTLFNVFLATKLSAKLEQGKCPAEMVQAIKGFQKGFMAQPDGRIDANGTTWKKLVAAAGKLGEGRSLLLSFDDGPAPVDELNRILSTLGAEAISAEFYVLGSEVKAFPGAAATIVKKGHRLQNHSWDHPNLAEASKATVQKQLQDTSAAILAATGTSPTKVRPPTGAGGWPGKLDPELAEVAGNMSLAICNWDIDTRDWEAPKGISAAKIAKIEEQFWQTGAKPVLMVLMHVQTATADGLPAFIKQLRKWGFGFAKP